MTDVLEELRFAESRLRELEECETQSIRRGNRVIELERRIVKAREILEKLVGTKHGKEIMQAIAVLQGQDALEGK